MKFDDCPNLAAYFFGVLVGFFVFITGGGIVGFGLGVDVILKLVDVG